MTRRDLAHGEWLQVNTTYQRNLVFGFVTRHGLFHAHALWSRISCEQVTAERLCGWVNCVGAVNTCCIFSLYF